MFFYCEQRVICGDDFYDDAFFSRRSFDMLGVLLVKTVDKREKIRYNKGPITDLSICCLNPKPLSIAVDKGFFMFFYCEQRVIFGDDFYDDAFFRAVLLMC